MCFIRLNKTNLYETMRNWENNSKHNLLHNMYDPASNLSYNEQSIDGSASLKGAQGQVANLTHRPTKLGVSRSN